MEEVSGLYNQVDELVHRLVTLSNKSTQELEFIVEFKVLEEGFDEVSDHAYGLRPTAPPRLQPLTAGSRSAGRRRGRRFHAWGIFGVYNGEKNAKNESVFIKTSKLAIQ